MDPNVHRAVRLSDMDIGSISAGDSIAGLLVDGVDSTPYTGATLNIELERGVVVEIPYIEQDPSGQFDHVSHWFTTQSPPKNMYLLTPDGNIGLFGNRWNGHTTRDSISLGKVMPAETVLGPCEAPLSKPLVLNEVCSQIDGLQSWTRLRSLNSVPITNMDNLVQTLDVRVSATKSDSWRQGEATLYFQSNWQTADSSKGFEGGLNINDETMLVSSFLDERPFIDHLTEQRRVVSLLTLLSGGPIHFRGHQVSAQSIVLRLLNGEIYQRSPRVPLISIHTVRELVLPKPSKSDLNWMLSDFESIGVSGLELWAAAFDKWKKFILPSAGLLGRKRPYMEDVITTLSFSVEAAGQIIGIRPEEDNTYFRGRPTTSTFVFRCFDVLNVDWGELAPDLFALARAVSNVYNGIKHFNSGDFPDPEVQRVVSVVLRYTVRLLALYIIDQSDELMTGYRKKRALLRAHNIFEQSEVRFDDRGNPVTASFGASASRSSDV